MKTWRWRVVLSVANLLWQIGQTSEVHVWLLSHSVSAEHAIYWATYCLDVVPTTAMNLLPNFAMTHHLLWLIPGGHLYFEYCLALFLFWWWVGWKIDTRAASRDCGLAGTIADFVLAVTLSLILFLQNGTVRHSPYPSAIWWAMIVWSVLLLCFSLLRLWRLSTLLGSGR